MQRRNIVRKRNKLRPTGEASTFSAMRRSAAGIRDALGTAVLHIRRGQATSRNSLAKILGIAASTAGLYVDTLIEHGFATESGLEQGPMGRPKRSIALCPGAGWFAGVEFYAARVQAVRADFTGNITASTEMILPPSPEAPAVIEAVASSISAVAKGSDGPLLGVGVGAPGLVDPLGGFGRDYRFIAQWHDVAIGEALRSRFNVPVVLENNLRAVALAEHWFGGGRGHDDFVCLGLRSGFGAGIVAGGKLVRGAQHSAGEIGRWLWRPSGGGAKRELQDLLSAPAIFRRVSGISEDAEVPPDLRAAFANLTFTKRNGAIKSAWEPVVHDLGEVVAYLHFILNPDVIFVHGPLTVLGASFCDTVASQASESVRSGASFPKVLPSKLDDNAGALGAASLAMEAWRPIVDGNGV